MTTHALTTRTTAAPTSQPSTGLLAEAAKLGCKYKGIHSGTEFHNLHHSCYVFTFEDQRYEIPTARPFPLSRLRDLHSTHLRNHQPVTA